MEKPSVSVCTITYGHEKFIAETIEGVLMQEVNFPIEYIIADDCSMDETERIVQAYIETHARGHWITYTKHKKNKGMNPNFVWALEQCKGKYIAYCEGDDYWTDPSKLQKQVDFLEDNKHYVISAHKSLEMSLDKQLQTSGKSQLKKDGNFNSILLNGLGMATLSIVFRNQIEKIPKWFLKSPNADYPLFLLLTEKGGKVKYMNEVMGVYRIHAGGIWSTANKRQMGLSGVKAMNIANEGFNFKYDGLFKDAIAYRSWWFGLKEYTFINYLKGEVSFTFYRKYFMNKINKKIRGI